MFLCKSVEVHDSESVYILAVYFVLKKGVNETVEL